MKPFARAHCRQLLMIVLLLASVISLSRAADPTPALRMRESGVYLYSQQDSRLGPPRHTAERRAANTGCGGGGYSDVVHGANTARTHRLGPRVRRYPQRNSEKGFHGRNSLDFELERSSKRRHHLSRHLVCPTSRIV